MTDPLLLPPADCKLHCGNEDCIETAVIQCGFQSLAFVREGSGLSRATHLVDRSWCWGCFSAWVDQLRDLAECGIGLADQQAPLVHEEA